MWPNVPAAFIVATLCQIVPFSQQHRFRDACPCATLPQEELSLRQVFQEVRTNRKHEIHCCPHILLGFPAHQYDDNSFNITWTFRGEAFPWVRRTSSFRRRYCHLETLESEGVLAWDGGTYTCTVTASDGTTAQRNTSLCVNVNEDIGRPPVEYFVSPDAHALEGERANLTCSSYVGRLSCLRPENHSISWRKEEADGSRVPVRELPRARTSQSENEEGMMSSNLVIESLERSHFGRYFCVVRNQHGSLTMNVTLLEGVPEMLRQRKLYQTVLLVMMSAVMIFLVVGAYTWPPCRMTIALYYSKKTSQGSPPEGFQQDVFLVHGDSASCWVWTVLLPMLEDTCGYTCFLPQRDMCGGDLMIEVMLGAVSKSRRVVVVVTPCLLLDPWAAWALHQAMNAALKGQAQILALVLKDPRAEGSVRDTSGILRILNLVQKIRVPVSCGLQGGDSFSADTKLTVAGRRGSGPPIRPSSRSPGAKRPPSSAGASREDLEANGRKKKKEAEGLRGGESRPSTSATPFIEAPEATGLSSTRHTGCCCCWRLPCTGNEEEMFWQTVRFHLGVPAFRRRPDIEMYKK